MDDKKKKDLEEQKRGGLFVPAGVLLGTGLGFAYGNIPAGALIGLGVVFTIFSLISVFKKYCLGINEEDPRTNRGSSSFRGQT